MKKKPYFRFRHYKATLTWLHVIADILSIGLSFFLAYQVWNILGPLLAVDMYEYLEITRYGLLFGCSLLTLLIGFEVNGLYTPQRSLLNVHEFRKILGTWALSLGVTIVLLYLADELYFSRAMLLLTWFFTLLTLLVQRYIVYKFNISLSRWGLTQTAVLIYGSGFMGRQLLSKFRLSPKLGYKVLGFIEDEEASGRIAGVPILGGFSQLERIIRETGAEKLFIALSKVSSDRIAQIVELCQKNGCEFQVVPSVYELALERVRMNDLEGIPLITIQEPHYSPAMEIAKRAFDLFFAFFFLVFFFPLFCLSSLLHFALFRGLFIRRSRLGKQAQIFEMLCFKGLPSPGRPDKNSYKASFWIHILTATGLDRYPQLWNIFKGEMSLVGPFAETPGSFEKMPEIRKHKFNVPPGLTGLWEIAPAQGTGFSEDSDLDIYYIQNHSLTLDFFILIRKGLFCLAHTFTFLTTKQKNLSTPSHHTSPE